MNNNSIQIKEIADKQLWESFLLSCDNPPFLQSWNAANQGKALGEDSVKLGIYADNSLKGVALVTLVRAKRGNFLYLPYGPVLKEFDEDLICSLTTYLSKWGREEGFDFIRMAPYLERSEPVEKIFASLGYRIAPIHMLSETVWKLDLSPTEDELLMNMRKTTRNLIRRAIKDGVAVSKSTNSEDIDAFVKLMNETHKRHHFVPYPSELYYKQVEAFKADDEVVVFRGIHDKQTIASSIVMYYGNAASYHHGASTPSKVPVAYLIQWEAIREAKRRGCKEYSFWGIVETDDKNHPFYGITKFKKGFGGEVRHLIFAQDYPLSKKYYLTYLIETARRIKRGFGWRRS